MSLLSVLAQTEIGGDIDLGDSGIGEVTTQEWILAVAVFGGAILLAIALTRLVARGAAKAGAPQMVARLAGRLVGYLMAVLGFFYALSSVDVRVGPILGALGIAGIALAFALQEILTNLVSGVILQVRRPFKIGDEIMSNDHEGIVEDVNLQVVTLRTFDGEHVMLPNSDVLQNAITNWTHTPTRRTTLTVGVAYGDDLAGVQQTLIDAITGLNLVESHPSPEAYVLEFGDSAVNFSVRFWHRAEIREMWKARDAVAQAIKTALDEAGYTIPFPQRTLWFGPGNTELALRQMAREER